MDDTDPGTGPEPGRERGADAEAEPARERTSCARCGAVAPGAPPLTWTFSMEDGEPRHICDTCSRTDIRAIEGRLDSTWW